MHLGCTVTDVRPSHPPAPLPATFAPTSPSDLMSKEAPELRITKVDENYVSPARAKVRATAGSVWEIYGKGKAGDVALEKRALEISMKISARLTRSAAGKIMAPTVVLNQLGVHNGIADTMV